MDGTDLLITEWEHHPTTGKRTGLLLERGRDYVRIASSVQGGGNEDVRLDRNPASELIFEELWGIHAADNPTPPVIEETTKHLEARGRRLKWTPCGGTWLVEVSDDSGTVIGSGVGDDAVDALLGVAEDLLPPE